MKTEKVTLTPAQFEEQVSTVVQSLAKFASVDDETKHAKGAYEALKEARKESLAYAKEQIKTLKSATPKGELERVRRQVGKELTPLLPDRRRRSEVLQQCGWPSSKPRGNAEKGGASEKDVAKGAKSYALDESDWLAVCKVFDARHPDDLASQALMSQAITNRVRSLAKAK